MSLQALAFVPLESVLEVYEELKEAFPEDEACDEILTYFENTYVKGNIMCGRQRPPLYRLELWNHYEAALRGEPRTTNACEGSHHAFNSLLTCTHPSIWRLLDAIKRDIGIQKKTLLDETTGQPNRKKAKYEDF